MCRLANLYPSFLISDVLLLRLLSTVNVMAFLSDVCSKQSEAAACSCASAPVGSPSRANQRLSACPVSQSIRRIHAFPHTHTHSPYTPQMPPICQTSIRLPSTSSSTSFLCGFAAVTAPSHVCQSQLAHLLLHTHTTVSCTPACRMQSIRDRAGGGRGGGGRLAPLFLNIFNLQPSVGRLALHAPPT